MSVIRGLRSRARSTASVGSVAALSTALVTLAVSYDGVPTAEVDLNDGGVWVTNPVENLVAHLNVRSAVLDGALRTVSPSFDVLQEAGTVLLADDQWGTVSPVDVAHVVLAGETQLPPGADIGLGGGTVAVHDPSDGRVWVLEASALDGADLDDVEPVHEASGRVAVAVGPDGAVHVADPAEGELLRFRIADDGAVDVRSEPVEVDADAELAVTAVGPRPVVLDRTAGRLLLPGGRTAAVPDAATAQLQQPGAAASTVLVQTGTALLAQPLDGGDVQVSAEAAAGVPVQPVHVAGCDYAVWAGSGRFVRDCPGTEDDQDEALPGATATAELRFRVNRDVVVLNDAATGAVWLADDTLTLVDNWDEVEPPPEDAEESDEDSAEETEQTALADRADQNRPPTAEDDSFGVRPGRTTVLPLLDNDTDPDGDVLVAAVAQEPTFGTIQSIRAGAAVQMVVPEDASGSASFSYTADDGRGGSDDADVTVTVRDWDENEAPEQRRVPTLTLAQGSSVTYNVLPDWLDPDGDDLVLVGAVATTEDAVTFRADGTVTFQDVGTTPGRKDVVLLVSDGQGTEPAEGLLRVDVRPDGQLPPVANADHVRTVVGTAVTVAPLDNDTDPDDDDLRLARVGERTDVLVEPDFEAGTVTVTADAVGSYYLDYLVTDGPHSTPGLIRVDVVDPAAAGGEPVAVRDVALLPAGGEVYVDVLTNDADPAGGVLVVQSVDVPETSGLRVAVLEHRVLRISAASAVDAPVSFPYTVSNGTASSTGQVLVVPVPRPATLQPPSPVDDEVVVRAGDVVTVPVLANDTHPDGDTLTLVPQLVQDVEPGQGLAFTDQDVVRFQAAEEAGTAHIIYAVRDSAGQEASAQVTIRIRERDPEQNSPPRPRDVTGRVLAGATVRIPVPLDGVDPDGDSVTLTGVDRAPALGRVVAVGRGWLEYEAGAGTAGTDRFSYAVEDRLGARATAAVTVGIAPASPGNQRPVAVDDVVTVRPDRQIAAPVLVNDTDPDGDRLQLVPDGLEVDAEGVTAEVVADRVTLRTPPRAGTVTIYYTVTDGRGGQAMGVLTVEVVEESPLLVPIARDDELTAADVADRATVDVEVLDNDEDPDGDSSALDVSTSATTAEVLPGGALRVSVLEAAQVLPYTVTDVDGLRATAFVWVPGSGDLRPRLGGTAPVEVVSGEVLTVPLADHVVVAPGRTARLTEAAAVSATNADGSELVLDATTLQFVSAERYAGPAAITFEVTDGSGPDDPDGRTAVLTLAITVLPPENLPPTFAGGSIEVAPGESSTTLDLAVLTTDPDPDDAGRMTFRLTGTAPAGIDAAVDGSVLDVSAAVDTGRGTSATLGVEVSDGTNPPVAGTVEVTVVGSTRPLATANDDVLADADQGQPQSVDVLANDGNPFPATPLTLVGEPQVESGSGSARREGERVVVTPAGDFVGTLVVRYRVADATGDPERHVDGRVLLTVRGRPAPPATPQVGEVRSRTVVLTWAPPASNGAPITGYTVRSGAGFSQACAATTCTLEGLRNDVEYTFTVTATNAVGESDPSPASAVARPDARPSTPAPPSLAFGDRSLTVTWAAPTGYEGSAVETYNLEISPAPPTGAVQRTGVRGTSVVWDGLENGVPYQVRVQAVNRAPEPSDWSSYSAGEIPAGVPATPAAPTTERLEPVGEQAQLRVAWSPPASNGAPVDGYTLTVLRGGSAVQTLPVGGDRTQQVVTVATSADAEYTFTVSATNKAGTSATSAPSAPRRSFVAPGSVGTVTATPGDRSAQLAFTDAAGNGARTSEIAYQYRVGSGGWQALPGGRAVTGLTNGTSYTFHVRAVTSLDGVSYPGPESAASNPVTPFGAPGQVPDLRAAADTGGVTYTWGAANFNGGTEGRYEVSANGGSSWSSVGTSTSHRRTGSAGQTLTLHVRACTANAGCGSAASASGTVVAPTPPSASVSRGANPADPRCTDPSCGFLVLNVQNFPAGTYTVKCHEGTRDSYSTFYTQTNVRVPANGSVQLQCFYGYAGSTVSIEVLGAYWTPGYVWPR